MEAVRNPERPSFSPEVIVEDNASEIQIVSQPSETSEVCEDRKTDQSVASTSSLEVSSQCHLGSSVSSPSQDVAPVISVKAASEVMVDSLRGPCMQSKVADKTPSVLSEQVVSSKQESKVSDRYAQSNPCMSESRRRGPGTDEVLLSCQPKECPLVIELFAGSGRVTAHLKHVGIKSAFGVDHKVLSKIAPIKVCDLTTKQGQRLCMEWCSSPLLAGVFIAPPCGTCSRAREIILRDSKGRPIPGPVPLRSDLHPNGIPFLSPLNRARVSSANKLYAFVTKLVLKLVALGVPVVIENPRNSIYWLTTFFQEIKKHFVFTAHQACAYGGKRPKWTALAHTHKIFPVSTNVVQEKVSLISMRLGVFRFTYINERVFATSEETAYPMDLAAEIASAFKDVSHENNWILEPPGWSHSSFAAMRAIAGNQPKASRVPPLASEHKFLAKIEGPQLSVSSLPQKCMQRCKKVLQIPPLCSSSVDVIPPESQLLRASEFRSSGGELWASQVWGIPWSICSKSCRKRTSQDIQCPFAAGLR